MGRSGAVFFVIIEHLSQLNQGMIDDFAFLAAYIEQWILKNTSADIFSFSQALFTGIFSGQTENIPVLERKLLSLAGRVPIKSCCLKPRHSQKIFHTDVYLCRTLNDSSQFILCKPMQWTYYYFTQYFQRQGRRSAPPAWTMVPKSRYHAGISFLLQSFYRSPEAITRPLLL